MYGGFTLGFKDVGQKEVGFTSTATVGSRWCYPREHSEVERSGAQCTYAACGLTASPTTIMAVSSESSLTGEVVNLELGTLQQISLGSQIGEAPMAKDDGATVAAGRFSPVCGIAEMADQTVALVQANGTVRIVDIDQASLRDEEELWQSELH
jgi:hypothetical protein